MWREGMTSKSGSVWNTAVFGIPNARCYLTENIIEKVRTIRIFSDLATNGDQEAFLKLFFVTIMAKETIRC